MTSKGENDTLPIPGYTQELTIDATVDEDFIPTSQPQSSGCVKYSDSSPRHSPEVAKDSGLMSNSELLFSVIDDTIPATSMLDPLLDRDRSADFIPETETKKRKIEHSSEVPACKKKLPVDKCTEDIFGSVVSSHWVSGVSKIPESPAPETQNVSVIVESPQEEDPLKDKNNSVTFCSAEGKNVAGESITEIIVNDSSETVDLEASSPKMNRSVGQKVETSYSFSSDVERCEREEVQDFDNSALLMDPAGTSSLSLNFPTTEKILNGTDTQKLYLNETLDDNGFQRKEDDSTSGSTLPLVPEFSKEFIDVPEVGTPKRAIAVKPENATSSEKKVEPEACSPRSLESRTINFKLSVNCLVTINTKTKKVHHKLILNVNEVPKPKPKVEYVERQNSDIASDKRYSTSSSGSVYSDKTGLPFALPRRVSAFSDQTDASDSSEEGPWKKMQEERKAFERMPWNNEYLLPLKMDELMNISIENEELILRPPNKPSPRRAKKNWRNSNGHLENVLESSSSEQTCKEVESEGEGKEESKENGGEAEKETEKANAPDEVKQFEDKPEVPADDNNSSVVLCDGLPVFARWTDRKYYPGVLSGVPKNDRWEIMFDDGTSKTVREDFVLPSQWLKVGELVFALVDDKYLSGQIIGVTSGKEPTYSVELDNENRTVEVQRSDLCLTEIMSAIVKEKYKPLNVTPRGKGSSDIDFDNVLTGKRLREQRTPLRAVTTGQTASSSAKKKNSSKGKKDEGTATEGTTTKETPQSSSSSTSKKGKTGGLQSDNGHLVEDKVVSTESPSTTEGEETPLRSSKEGKAKGKPRSLSHGTKKTDWLAPDGTPIPGSSGVKYKKRTPGQCNTDLEVVPEEGTPVRRGRRLDTEQTPEGKKAATEKTKGKRKFNVDADEDPLADAGAEAPDGKKTEPKKKSKGRKR